MTNDFPFPASRRKFVNILAAAPPARFPLTAALGQGSNLSKMKIATIGAGREGGALGTLFAKLGHPVMFSSRHPEELKALVAAAGPTASAGTTAEAVAFGEVIFLVVPYPAVEQIGKDFGPALAKKPLILDVSNPIPARDGQEIVTQVAAQGGARACHQEAAAGVKDRAGFQRDQFRDPGAERASSGRAGRRADRRR